MNTALIMLGSNTKAEQNIKLAIEQLRNNFEIVKQSSTLQTKPQGEHYKSDFLNLALKIRTFQTAEETVVVFKQIEKNLGRTPESKSLGLIPIDIDLIIWNDEIVHQDYTRFPFVKDCIDMIR